MKIYENLKVDIIRIDEDVLALNNSMESADNEITDDWENNG